jgi:hypothetical protein
MGFDTVEVWGSSPHVPTISFNHLAVFAPLDQPPSASEMEVTVLQLSGLPAIRPQSAASPDWFFPDGIIRKKISLDNIFNEVGVNSKSGLRRQSRLTSSRKPSRGRSRQQPVHVDLARRPDAHLPHWQPSALAICDAPDYIHRNFLAIRRLDEVEIGDRSPLGSPTEFPHRLLSAERTIILLPENPALLRLSTFSFS